MPFHRPPFILAIAADVQGCCWHRMQVPLGFLVAGHLAEGRLDMQAWPDEAVAAARPDVVVWQRQVEDGHFEAMRRYRRLLPHALFVYELDDNLAAVPDRSFHRGYMPPHLAERVAQGIALCDRASTTTEPMAAWLRSLGAMDVRVAPNAVPMARLRERKPRLSGKLRIGWFGGLSHDGDLDLIGPAMAEIGEDVEWVFMGMQPVNAPCRVEFHPGMPPSRYLDGIAALDLDLVLAPLEDNEFNRCKSNLRLLEAACVGAPVLAQAAEPYLADGAPVSHASTPGEWTAGIRAFMHMRPSERDAAARRLRAWVGARYSLEATSLKRVAAWLPDGERWAPKPPTIGGANHAEFVVAVPGGPRREALPPFMRGLKPHRLYGDLESACRASLETGADVLWMRPGTALDEPGWNRLRAALKTPNQRGEGDVASACPLASDGLNAFPRERAYTPLTDGAAVAVRDACRARMVGRIARVAASSGPCVLLSAAALSMFGIPDVAGCGAEEAAILEWGLRVVPKGMRHVQCLDAYVASMMQPAPLPPAAAVRLQARGFAQWAQAESEGPDPADREAVEFALLRSQWGGPKPGLMGFANDYAAWKALRGSLSAGAASPSSGSSPWPSDWVLWTSPNAELHPGAREALAAAAASAPPEVAVVYGDHDMPQGGKSTPDFKPDFDMTLFMGRDYVTQVCAVRRDRMTVLPADCDDVYGILLNLALAEGRGAFLHVPEILATVQDASPEEKAVSATRRRVAIEDATLNTVVVEPLAELPGALRVRHVPQVRPKVSIVVPTLGHGRLIQPCVNTVLQLTDYPDFEVVVVHNGPLPEPELGDAASDSRVRVVRWEPTDGGGFNWSAACNFGASEADGYFLCFLNDDCCVANRGWLDAMVGRALEPDAGAVGARLLHPMGMYQHVGVVVNRGLAGHLHSGLPVGNPGYWGLAVLSHECSAVTGACLLVSARKFEDAGGFDELFSLDYNDVDFCMRLRRLGLVNSVEASAELVHGGASTRLALATPEGFVSAGLRLAEHWPDPDPYWNPNLALGMAPDGGSMAGLNCDSLAWTDAAPKPDAQRTLVLNDQLGTHGVVLDLVRDGQVPFAADLSCMSVSLLCPQPANAPPWDIRDPARLAAGLRALGIGRVVLRSLVGRAGAAAPVESLACLGFLADAGIAVEVDPIEDALVAPWLDDSRLALFGGASVAAWRDAYDRLFGTILLEAAE